MPVSTTGRPAAVLSVLVTSNTRAASANIAAMERQTAYSVKRMNASWASHNRATQAAARGLTAMRFATVGAAAAMAGSVKAAADYESAFSNVRKTVGGSRQELNSLSQELLTLSTRVPATAVELANLAGEAGALGVKAKDLKTFTNIAQQLGIAASDLSAEQAASGLARMANIMDLDVSKSVRRMGDVLTELGNKGASTEGEILEMSKRIAGSGKVVGLASHEVMGLSAGLANLGIRAEMGGSAVSRVLRTMHVAAREGGKELDLLAKTAGMQAPAYAKLIDEDMVGALGRFLDGLAQVEKDGRSAQLVLRDLGKSLGTNFGEIRISDTLMRVMSSGAGSASELAKAMKLANKEQRTGGALAAEAHKKYDTLAGSLEILRNNVVKAGIDFGTGLIPEIKETVDLLKNPDISMDEKVSGLVHQLGEIFKDASPMLAEVGGDLAGSLFRGMVHGWWEADWKGKLFMSATLLRVIGGPGTLMALGGAIARPIFAGIAGAFTATTLFQSILGGKAGVSFISGPAGTTAVGGIGKSIGQGLAWWTANAIPIAFAAAGIGNLLVDVLGGDLEDAAWEGGGILAGALIGGLAGGLPGAMVGMGIGSLMGDLLDKAFTQPDEPTFAERYADATAKGAAAAAESLKSLVRNHGTAEAELREARQKARKATNAEREAEEHLDKVRREHGPNSKAAIRAEGRYKRVKHESAEASRELRKAERLPRQERKYEAAQLQEIVAEQSQAVQAAEAEEKQAYRTYKQLRKGNAEREERSAAFADWQEKSAGVRDAESKLNETLQSSQKLLGGKYTKRLERVGERLGGLAGKQDKLALKVDDTAEAYADAGTSYGYTKEDVDSLAAKLERLRDKQESVGTSFEKLIDKGISPFRRSVKDADTDTKKSTDNQVENWKNLDGKTKDSIRDIRAEVGAILEDLGVKDANFSVSSSSGSDTKQKKQQGGFTVPGTGVGDKMLTKVWTEPGEDVFVLNSRAAKERRDLEAWNSQFKRHGTSIPKRQAGGSVTGDTGGLVPQFMSALQAMSSAAHTPISVTSGLRSRAEQEVLYARYLAGTGNLAAVPGTSHHEQGIAADISPGSGTFGSIAGRFGLGFTVPGEAWHIELLNAAAAGKFGAKAQTLAKRVMHGPSGGMTRIGQGALDKVKGAGDKFIASKMPSVSSVVGGALGKVGGAMSEAAIEKLAASVGMPNPHLMAAIAMAESGGQVGVINSIGATGLWQVLQSAHPQYSQAQLTSARGNAMAAKQILHDEGLGAWEAYTNGNYAQYLQQGGRARKLNMPEWGGWFGGGGSITARKPTMIGLGERGAETAVISRGAATPNIELRLYGPGWDKFVSEMELLVDGKKVSGDKHKVRMMRQRGR